MVKNVCGFELKVQEEVTNEKQILLKIDTSFAENFHQISCSQNAIEISGGTNMALFNGIQTINQIVSINTGDSKTPVILAFNLKDKSKFKWRGMLLDVCRHYFPKEVVLKYIDLLAFYKLNVLHWHITEDQAWRIAIDAYPKLTEVGAWRTEKNGENYGGFYSKEDIREIVKYASERHVQIVPEIEMPGHSSAAVASYPFLGCNGEQIPIPNDWGVFKDIYCPTEETFTFLETVLTEVMELFPSNYVHIGGDEAPKTRWEESEFCQNLMKTEGLHDYEELQSYFINRMAKFLENHGKTIIGWDEILNEELVETAIIQSWRGMEGGKKAVSEGRKAIMSPTSHCYLDYSLKAIDTEKIYHFNPIPDDCSPEESARILGGECNMWTEHVPDEQTLDSKVFPRLIAASEAFWSEKKDYSNFLKRLDAHYTYLENKGVSYGKETVAFKINTSVANNQLKIELKDQLRNSKTTYQIAEGDKDISESTLYTEPIVIEQYGEQLYEFYTTSDNNKTEESSGSLKVNLHSFLDADVDYTVKYSDYYTAGGDKGLSDGVLGSLDFRDGHWQGFFGDDAEITMQNPNSNQPFSHISMNFYRYINSWIFPPESVSLSVSDDGENFQEMMRFSFKDEEKHVRGKSILAADFPLIDITAKYLRVNIKNIGKVPHWHEASGEPAWIFIDEIVVN